MGHGELCTLAFSRTANDVFLQLTWGPPSPTSLSPCSLALLHPSLQKASEPPEAEGLWGRRTCSCQGFRPQRSWLLSRFSLFFFLNLVFEPAGEKLFPQRKAGIQDQVNHSFVSAWEDGPLGGLRTSLNVTNSFLVGFQDCSTRRNICLVLWI